MNNINNTKFNKATEEIQKIAMTPIERKQILKSILNSPAQSTQPIKSPWNAYSFVSFIRHNRMMSYSIASFLVLILSSQGIVFASENSLPGDILYPIKVKVVEPVRAALATSPEKKAKYESTLATKRLVEAETLAVANKLDDSKEKELNDLLSSHTKELDKALTEIDQTKSPDEVDDIVTNFQAGMNAHAEVLDIIHTPDNTQGDSSQYIENVKISRNAREIGGRVRNNFNKDEKHIPAKYTKRKDTVQALIDSTTNDLNQATLDNTSEDHQAIIEDTHKKLDEAKKFLDEANNEDKKEDPKNAYGALLDSESSAKEANIFLKTGLNLKGENGKNKRERNLNYNNKWRDRPSKD